MIEFRDFSFTSEPSFDKELGFVVNGSAELSEDNSVYSVIWEASLPIKNEPNLDDVKLHLLNLDGQNNEELNNELNQSHGSSLKGQLVSIAAASEAYRFLSSFGKNASRTATKLAPLTSVPNPKPLSAYFLSTYQVVGSSFSVIWSYTDHEFYPVSFDTAPRGLDVTRLEHGFWDLLSKILNEPDLNEKHEFLDSVIALNSLEIVLSKGYDVGVESTINYSNNSKSCLIDLSMKVHGLTFKCVVKGRNEVKRLWDFDVFGFVNGNAGKFIQFSELSEIFNKDCLAHRFIVSKSFDALKYNHSQKKENSIHNGIDTFLQAKKHFERISIVEDKTNLYSFSRRVRFVHEISGDNSSYVRFFWDLTLDLSDGVNSVFRASCTLANIRVSGIKYIFFPDSEKTPELLQLLGNKFRVAKSKDAVLSFSVNELEPMIDFWRATGMIEERGS